MATAKPAAPPAPAGAPQPKQATLAQSSAAPRPLGAPPAGSTPPSPIPKAAAAPPSPSPAPPAQNSAPQQPAVSAKPQGSGNTAAPQQPKTNSGSGSSAKPESPNITKPGAKQPLFARVRQSPFKFLPFILGGLAVVGLVAFLIYRFVFAGSGTSTTTPTSSTSTRTTVPAQQTTITYWGLWEPTEVLASVIQDFERANPTIKVQYQKQNHVEYRERLQTAIASGQGPDAFRFHASWTPMLKNELAPMPNSVMSVSQYQQTFYPVAAAQLQNNGQIVGVPLMYDGLELYYNKQALQAAGAQPPTTWAEVKTLATTLTIRADGGIERAGMAIGNASNVEHFSDIIGLLMLQNGADLTNPTSQAATEALEFYTNFATKDKVWDETLPSSTVAFARGDVAMMLAPSWRAHEIQASNPNLDFGIVAAPKLGAQPVAWATYWAEGVSSKSSNKDAAWQLLKFLSSADVMKQLYSAQSQTRAFGEPYSRVDLANELAGDPLVSPYLETAPAAQGWHLSSYTHDNGINDLLIRYYRDAVNAVVGGKSAEEAMATVAQGTTQVLRQYGVTTAR